MHELHICNACPIKHYDNCRMCFGFGVFRKNTDENIPEIIPVVAWEAHEKAFREGCSRHGTTWPEGIFPCPECGSTELGLPVQKPIVVE